MGRREYAIARLPIVEINRFSGPDLRRINQGPLRRVH
jgi:hypothetical protein